MIDFPIAELLDDSICLICLERHLHPDGLQCRRCGSTARRLFRHQGHFPAYRCGACDGYYMLLKGTVFEKTHQQPATLVLLLRGIAKGEPTAPTAPLTGTTFEAGELYQNAGEKSTPHCDPSDPPRRCANKRKGLGTYANDRPPIISLISREKSEQRWWVCDRADRPTCHTLIADNFPLGST
jgi:hypothetical protein